MSGPRPSLAQCLTLALLIHVLLVLVLGNTPDGTARPGQGVWGALNIRLAGGDAAGQPEASLAAATYTGPDGSATQQRWGGAVRTPEALPRAQQVTGAARLGHWQRRAADRSAAAGVPAAASPAGVPTPSGPPKVAVIPAPSPSPSPSPSPTPTAATAPEPTAATVPVLAAASVAVAAAEQPSVPVPAWPVQVPTPAPAPAPATAPAPAPAPPRTLPVAALPQPIQALSAPALQPVPVEAVPVEAVPLPTFTTQALTAPAAPPLPTRPARAPMPLAEPAALASPIPARPPVELTAAAALRRRADPAALEPPADPAAGSAWPTPAGPNPPLTAGAHDAGARLGQDVATPPSLPASAPRLNLELVRPRGGAISAQGSRGLLPMLPHPPEHNSQLADDIAKSAKADCRKAYGSLGLAAVLPLAVDVLRDNGCRW